MKKDIKISSWEDIKQKRSIRNVLMDLLKKIEGRAYPSIYQSFTSFTQWSDFEDYCETSRIIVLWDDNKDWYLLLGISGRSLEVIDLASLRGLSHINMEELLKKFFLILKDHNIEKILMDMRETTSYKFIKIFDNNIWKIIKDQSYDWEGEIFHDIIIRKR